MGVLRLLLALSVIAAHTSAIRWLALPTGTAAVQIFFVISGFYMALILNEKYLGPGSYRIFIANRFLRIYPVYFVMAGATLILALALHTEIRLFDPERLSELNLEAKTLIFGANFAIFGLDTFDFLAIQHGALVFVRNTGDHPLVVDHMRLVPQAWSLGIELLFYIIAPFIVRRILWIVAVSVLSLSLRAYLWQHGYTAPPWNYEFFPSELVFFLIGALLYHAQRTALFERWGPTLAVFAPFATGLALFTYDDLPGILSYGLVIVSIPFLFELTKRNRVDRLVGELSYPLYVVHFFFIYGARAIAPDLAHSGRFSSICVGASLALSLAIYRFVIVPIDRWRERSAHDMLPAIAAPQTIEPTAILPILSARHRS